MTVREIVSLLKDAKDIKIGYEETVYHFNQNDSVSMTAFGKFVVDGIYAIEVTDTTKTSAGHRTIPLTPSVLFAQKKERNNTNSLFVFQRKDGQPMTQSAFRRMWSHAEKIDVGAPQTSHILRHTFCTRLFEKGFDVKEIQYLMGHSTPEMT